MVRVTLERHSGWRPAAWLLHDPSGPRPVVHVRHWVLWFRRVSLSVLGHELADFHDPSREQRESDHAGHGCGMSDGFLGLFSLRCIPPECLREAEELLRVGSVEVASGPGA